MKIVRSFSIDIATWEQASALARAEHVSFSRWVADAIEGRVGRPAPNSRVTSAPLTVSTDVGPPPAIRAGFGTSRPAPKTGGKR